MRDATFVFTTILERQESSLSWNYYFLVPRDVSQQILQKGSRRVICSVNEQVSFHAALMPDGKGEYNVLLNQEKRNNLGLRNGETLNISLQIDRSTFGVEVSEEFMEVLYQDINGALSFFDKLTPGKQRSLIHWVDSVKSSEIRIRRALVLVSHLLQSNGKIDFKVLNQMIKKANSDAKLGRSGS